MIMLSSQEEAATKAQAFALGGQRLPCETPRPPRTRGPAFATTRAPTGLSSNADEAFARLAELNRNLEQKVAERSAELVHGRDTLIFGLAKLAESRDDETGKHLERDLCIR